ncbi:MAG TPA: DUF401 family protein [Thermoplasmatales archaeon]|nr:DUF401 family protein [Thermoplasmatales archaeon]
MLNLVGVIVSFGVIIFLIRKKWNFGISLLIGSLIVGFFSLQEVQIVDVAKAFAEACIYSFDKGEITTATLELVFIMILINILAVMMQETGAMTKLINSLRRVFSKGAILAVIPAVFGLLPVPGGALFSAPMVDKEGDKLGVSKEDKTLLNVWFRHIWFFVYPLSSAMILICSRDFANINIYHLVALQFPGFLVMILTGIIVLRKSIPKKTSKESKSKDEGNFHKNGIIYLTPIIVPILLSMFISTFLHVPSTTSILISLPFGILSLSAAAKTSSKEITRILRKGLSWKLPFAIIGIMVFREMILTSKAVDIIANAASNSHIPAIIIVVSVPFILGLITGYNLGAVALSYPIVEPFFPLVGTNIVAFASLVFISSLLGYIMSPIHLCVVVTCEYFKTDLSRIYKRFIPAALFLLLINTIIMMTILR